jgi:hypothetical protein
VLPSAGIPAEPVRGRSAYWLDRTLWGNPGQMLAWEWGAGAWAFVDLPNGTPAGSTLDDELRGQLHSVAEAVHTDGDEPVTVPFTMPLPEGRRLTGTSVVRGTSGDTTPFVIAAVHLGEVDSADPHRVTLAESGSASLVVSVGNGASPDDKGGTNRTIAGHPARIEPGVVVLFGFPDGFSIEVGGDARLDEAALIALAQSVQVLRQPSDERTWTSAPLG